MPYANFEAMLIWDIWREQLTDDRVQMTGDRGQKTGDGGKLAEYIREKRYFVLCVARVRIEVAEYSTYATQGGRIQYWATLGNEKGVCRDGGYSIPVEWRAPSKAMYTD